MLWEHGERVVTLMGGPGPDGTYMTAGLESSRQAAPQCVANSPVRIILADLKNLHSQCSQNGGGPLGGATG